MNSEEPYDFEDASAPPPREGWEDMPEGFGRDDEDTPEPSAAPKEMGASPADVVGRWQTEGPLVRRAVGIPSLDAACRGGLPFPWRMVVIGAPSAGKTAILMHIGRHLVTAHPDVFVGVLAVDEDDDDLTVRLAQMAGFSIEECETREPAALARLRSALESMRVRFYGGEYTIERAAEDTARRAKDAACRPAFVVDSIQTVRADAGSLAETVRGRVDANVAAVRAVATKHRMLVIPTSEANRNAYRSADAADTFNDMAAGKESGGIEFSAQTLLMVRTPKGYPDYMSVTVPKNRRGARAGFEFFLRLNRASHSITECADPTEGDAEHHAEKRAVQEKHKNVAQVTADARALAVVVRETPDMGENALRGAIRAKGHRWGIERLNGARTMLAAEVGVDGVRLVNGGDGKASRWRLMPVSQGASND